jgi:putative transposase
LKISVICKVLCVSRSGYYAWRHRVENPPSKRVTERLELIDQIRVLHRKHRYYGSPRIHRELLAANVQVGRHKVAQLMRANGICARRGKVKARPRSAPPARRPEVKDLVKRDFHADVADALWFTDITQVRTLQGWLFAAVILDAFNREVVSYAVDGHQTPNTAIRALLEALQIRRPPPGCVIHSDRGYQFTSRDWLELADGHGMRVSIGERKSAYDNATMESWFASYKNEELYPNGRPATRQEARSRLFGYVWDYNHIRLHSSLGYVPPVVYAADSSICP